MRLSLKDGGDKTQEEARAEWNEESVLTPLGPSTANSTLTPELQEAEVFIMDNKRCDRIYRKKSLIPRMVPLVLGDMICATNYGENLCYVSFGKVLAAPLLLGTAPRFGRQFPGEGFAWLPSLSPTPGSTLLPSFFSRDFDFA